MAKKSVRSVPKKEFDFFFLLIVSVFSAMTVFATSYISHAKKDVAARRRALDVAQLELLSASPTPIPSAIPAKVKVAPKK
jgi:hypothetical protein